MSTLLKHLTTCFCCRLDTPRKGSQSSDEWLLLLWSPEDSPIRQKMLFASTKATLKRQFGSTQIKEELFASSREEATLAAFKKQQLANSAPAPLTMRVSSVVYW